MTKLSLPIRAHLSASFTGRLEPQRIPLKGYSVSVDHHAVAHTAIGYDEVHRLGVEIGTGYTIPHNAPGEQRVAVQKQMERRILDEVYGPLRDRFRSMMYAMLDDGEPSHSPAYQRFEEFLQEFEDEMRH